MITGYLFEGCSMRELSWGHYAGHRTVCIIIHETLKVLWKELISICLRSPTKEDFKSIERGYYKIFNMPNSIGAVEGSMLLSNVQNCLNLHIIIIKIILVLF